MVCAEVRNRLPRRRAGVSLPAVKRLVWLLIATFLTAVSQVQAVDVRLIPADEKCCCCDGTAGACGMPDCAPAPTAGCVQSVQLQSPAPAVARRIAAAPRTARPRFYDQFLPRVSVVPALPVAAVVAPAASVSLFREHCSFLL
jgi:hypothetical protein